MTHRTKLKHDQLIRKAFEYPLVRQEFFETHLPAHIKALFSLETIKMEKDSFIDQNLSESITDILFSAKYGNEKRYIWLLLEHQSTVDRFMALRLFKYMISIAERHMVKHGKTMHLPIVYPLIFFNSEKKYTAPLNIWELFENGALAKEIWSNDLQLVNVHDIPDEELKKQAWSGILQFFLKHIHERNLLKRWHEIADLLPQFIEAKTGLDYIALILYYTLTKIEQNDKIPLSEMLKEHLNPETGEKLMTSLAHYWEQQGFEKAAVTLRDEFDKELSAKLQEEKMAAEAKLQEEKMAAEAKLQEEKKEIARRILARNRPLDEIIEFTGLTKAQIANLN